MIRIAPVSYTNTFPLIYGLDLLHEKYELEIVDGIPSELVTKLQRGEVDLALLPVGALNDLSTYTIHTQYGLATDTNVASVCIFSYLPIQELTDIFLDYHSRSSAALTRWLFKNYWKMDINFINTNSDEFIDHIGDTKGGLIIGDRALERLGHFPYVYDLGKAWKEATELPFVFAVWVSVSELDSQFLYDFERNMEVGLENLDKVIAKNNLQNYHYDMLHYYTNNIVYKLTDAHRRSIEKFVREMD